MDTGLISGFELVSIPDIIIAISVAIREIEVGYTIAVCVSRITLDGVIYGTIVNHDTALIIVNNKTPFNGVVCSKITILCFNRDPAQSVVDGMTLFNLYIADAFLNLKSFSAATYSSAFVDISRSS